MKALIKKNILMNPRIDIRKVSPVLLPLIMINLNCSRIENKEWTTFRSDNRQSGITAAMIKTPVALIWIYTPAHRPRPAWSAPAEELERAHFDKAYHVVVSDETVFYGSGVDNKIYAIDAATGTEKWTFFSEGPVRCAPTIWKNRLFFGSDDGYVYCLSARNGKLVWKFRAGPSDEKVLGNGRMISRWPVRTNVIVDDKETDKQKAARMLQYALSFSDDQLKATIEKSLDGNPIN